MRYTEAKLSPIGELMLTDLEKNTVDLVPNYDESEREPEVLPGLFPALLCNGSSGIAVGMSADFLPHSAKDVYKALDKMLANAQKGKDTDIGTIIDIIGCPDFPTGGVIVNQPDVWKAYREGHGRCVVRSKYHIEQWGARKDRDAIVITELPFGVNKAKLVLAMGKLASENEDFERIAEVRDESDRNGLRIVIELKRDTQTNIMINRLLKKTDMQVSLPIHHNALVDGHPQIDLSLKDLCDKFLEHAITVLQRKAAFEHDKLGKRLHIIEALLKALEDVDQTIACLKAKSRSESIKNLKKAYQFDDDQATAVANMHFYALNEEDKSRLENEQNTLSISYEKYDTILNDTNALLSYTREELKNVVAKYFSKDTRRTEISTETDNRDTIPDTDVVIAYTHNGYVKSVKLNEYNTQHRNGKGVSFKTKEDDFVESIHTLSTRDDLVVITSYGKAYVLPAYKIPTLSKSSIGKPIHNYIDLASDEKVIKFLVLTNEDRESDKTILFVTKMGIGKRMKLDQLPQRKSGARIMNLRSDEDELVSATLVNDDEDIVIISMEGQTVRFHADKVSTLGRLAAGVTVMSFKYKEDAVVSAFAFKDGDVMLQVMESGMAKRVKSEEIPVKLNRGGKGVMGLSNPDRVGKVVAAGVVKESDDCMVITQNGMMIRTPASFISVQSRMANGVKLINLADGDSIASVTVVDGKDETAS